MIKNLYILLKVSVLSLVVYSVYGLFNGSSPIIDDIDDRSIKANISYIQDNDEDVIKLKIDSYGGSVFAGNNLILAMEKAKREKGQKIECEIIKAFSMGFHIMAHCDIIQVYPETVVMQHMIHNGRGRENMKVYTKETRKTLNFLDNLNMESQIEFINLEESEFKKYIEFGMWLSAKELICLVNTTKVQVKNELITDLKCGNIVSKFKERQEKPLETDPLPTSPWGF